MKLLIMAPGKFSKTTKMIEEEAKKLFKEVHIAPMRSIGIEAGDEFKLYYEEKDILKYDYLLPRIDSKRAELGYHLMKFYDLIGMRKPYNAESILIAHNKFATIFELKKAGLPVPATWLAGSKKTAEDLLLKVKFPAVIKLVSSFGGKGVMFAESLNTAKSILKTLDLLKEELMIEDFIEGGGEDIRMLVIGDEIVSMKRIAKKGENRANIYAGGRGVSYKPSEEEINISLKSAEILKANICAVDLMKGKDGPNIIELNINPGITGLTKTTGVNVAQKIAKFIYEEAKK